MKLLSFISTSTVDKLIVNHFWELDFKKKNKTRNKKQKNFYQQKRNSRNAKRYFCDFLNIPRNFFLFIGLISKAGESCTIFQSRGNALHIFEAMVMKAHTMWSTELMNNCIFGCPVLLDIFF